MVQGARRHARLPERGDAQLSLEMAALIPLEKSEMTFDTSVNSLLMGPFLTRSSDVQICLRVYG